MWLREYTPNGSGWASSATVTSITFTTLANAAPTVSASATPTTVIEGGTVTLTGSASDADGDSLTYLWTSNGGGTFSSRTTLSPTWVAPTVTSTTSVTLTLRVYDGTVYPYATAAITVNPNTAPTASASATPPTVLHGGTVTLTGTASDINTGDTLTYAWTSSGGGTFSSTTILSPTWVAPTVSVNTDVTLTLTVNDGTVDTAATVTVTVNVLPPAMTSVVARSVGPERIQIIANIAHINSTTAISFRYRVTAPQGQWTTATENASANDTTAIHKITSGLAVGTGYDFEASLSSNFATSVSATHTHLGTTFFIIDTDDEELYEFTDVSDWSLNIDQGTFASTIDEPALNGGTQGVAVYVRQ